MSAGVGDKVGALRNRLCGVRTRQAPGPLFRRRFDAVKGMVTLITGG